MAVLLSESLWLSALVKGLRLRRESAASKTNDIADGKPEAIHKDSGQAAGQVAAVGCGSQNSVRILIMAILCVASAQRCVDRI